MANRSKITEWNSPQGLLLLQRYAMYGMNQKEICEAIDVPERTFRRWCQQDPRIKQAAKDIHESSLAFQKSVRDVYLDAVHHDRDLHVVDCSTADDAMASPEEVFARIRNLVNRYVDRVER